jgi:uncharacterized protein DUF397
VNHADISKASWRKASYCNGATACVEVAPLPDGGVGLRDAQGGLLQVPGDTWQHFAESIAHRLRADVGALTLVRVGNDRWEMRLDGSDDLLEFTDREVAMFVAGVQDGEFDLEALALPVGDGSGVDGAPRVPDGATAVFGGGSVPV